MLIAMTTAMMNMGTPMVTPGMLWPTRNKQKVKSETQGDPELLMRAAPFRDGGCQQGGSKSKKYKGKGGSRF